METSHEFPSELEKLTLVLLHSRGEVQRLGSTAEGKSFGITVGQGLASLRNDCSLYARADSAMNQAKRGGKN